MNQNSATHPWSRDRALLRKWLKTHLLFWLGGAALWIVGAAKHIGPLSTIGVAAFLLSIVPYVTSLVFAYRVQDALNRANLYKPGAWQIIVGGLLLNPYFIGFAITASVLAKVRQIEASLTRNQLVSEPVSR